MIFRRILMMAALAAVGTALLGQVRTLLKDPSIWPPDDFIEYWAAAKLTLSGQNPYDANLLLPLQQANGRDTDKAIMMWNPPWSLTVVVPLGLLPAREAQLLWLAVNFAAILICGDRLWLLLGGSKERRWAGWAIALTALPTLFALQSGQISPLLLLGGVLFLECERRGWHFAAGAATVLLAIKPHLAYLVWVAILCHAIGRGRWRIVLGGAATAILCSAVPLVFNTDVWRQYLDALANRTPEEWLMPTLGSLLRLVFGGAMFGLQFVPVFAGLAWFARYWTRYEKTWDWDDQIPLLLLVSFLTAPYGAWPFDMVLLLPAALWLVLRVHGPARGPVIAGLIAVNVACFVLNVLKISSFWFIWVAPVMLLLYYLGIRGSSLVVSASDSRMSNDAEAVPA
jgi:hypothetical protein